MNFNVSDQKNEKEIESNKNSNYNLKMKKYEEYNETNSEVLKLMGELKTLKDMAYSAQSNPNVDEEIIIETNKQIQAIEKDLIELRDSATMLRSLVLLDDDNLDEVEELVFDIDEDLDETIANLDNSSRIITYNKTLKIVTGAVVGGTLFGGVGAVFGLIPSLGGAGFGIGAGGIIARFI